MELNMEIPQLKIELPYDPAIPILTIHLKECAPVYDKATCAPMFTAALFTTVNVWKQPRCPMIGEWMKKCGLCTQWSFIHP
jgi:hypothetical protein